MADHEEFDVNNLGDQFRAEVEFSSNAFNIGFLYAPEDDIFLMKQAGEDQTIFFNCPTLMRSVAKSILSLADKWDRGEFKPSPQPERKKS